MLHILDPIAESLFAVQRFYRVHARFVMPGGYARHATAFV